MDRVFSALDFGVVSIPISGRVRFSLVPLLVLETEADLEGVLLSVGSVSRLHQGHTFLGSFPPEADR